MAATRITALPAAPSLDYNNDVFPIVDVSATTPITPTGTTSKATLSQVDAVLSASGNKAIVVDNAAALKALTVSGIADGQLYITRGYYSDNDGGQGTYIYDSASAASDNGGTVIAPTAGAGRFLLQVQSSIDLRQFGAKGDGAFDNTSAITNATAYLDSIGGGTILLSAGTWLMNWVCTSKSITLQSMGGKGEYDQYVIRPFNIASAPITFGDYSDSSSTITRYCKVIGCHVSGTNGSNSALSANNAPNALLLKGNTVSTTFRDCVFYGGLKTVSIVTQAGVGKGPVTGVTFENCIIRNDITNSSSARAIYAVRSDSTGNGYVTDNVFSRCKVNMTTGNLGYAAEFDGTIQGIIAEFYESYFDIQPGLGLLLKNSSLSCWNLNLDPGTTGVVVIESDSPNADPARIINGYLYQSSQKYKYLSGEVTLPSEGIQFGYNSRLLNPYISDRVYINPSSDPFGTSRYWDFQTASGPLTLNGLDVSFKSTTQASSLTTASVVSDGGVACAKSTRIGGDCLVYGGNASLSAQLTAATGSGGVYLAAFGTNQSVQLVPSGTSYVAVRTGNLIPLVDNTYSCGQSGARWSEIWAGNGTIQTSDENAKEQISDIDDRVLKAWSKVKFSQYKFKDAVSKKGEQARWHFGVIAQRVKEAFESEGLNAFDYGLLCWDKWEEITEDVRDQEGNFTGEKQVVIKPGESFGIRYDEALALECAYLRSRLGI